MSYQPATLTLGRAMVLVGWTALIAIVFGMLLFLFTFGDCYEKACRASERRAGLVILATGFVLYWAGFIALIRLWSRE